MLRASQTLHRPRSFLTHRRPVRRRLFNSVTPPPKPLQPLRTALSTAALLVGGTFLAFYYADSRSSIHRYLITPLVRNGFDAETGQK